MIGQFPGDEPEPEYNDLIQQRKAVRRRITGCATARARIAYQQARLQQSEHHADLAARLHAFTTQLDLLDQMEGALREREAYLTLRIRAYEP